MASNVTSNVGFDVQTQHQLVCPQRKSETHGAKFCPECGPAA
jgi:hypothetical protein